MRPSIQLVQILLPLYDNEGKRQPRVRFERIRKELTDRFGGMTAYTRAPAEGIWKRGRRRASREDIVVYEVMVPLLEVHWWKRYRRDLEQLFRQQEIVLRAQAVRLL